MSTQQPEVTHKHKLHRFTAITKKAGNLTMMLTVSLWHKALFISNVLCLMTVLNFPSMAMMAAAPHPSLGKKQVTGTRSYKSAPSFQSVPTTPSQMVVYTLGNLPVQLKVHQGQQLEFSLQSDKGANASFSYALDVGYPVPNGNLSLNAGVFSYTPAKTDKFEFSVRFSSTVNSVSESQSVIITPVASLQPETDLLLSTRAIPDPENPDFQVVNQTLSKTPELFNGVTQPTRNIEISGKQITFAANDPKNTLYQRFHNATDIKNFSIYAETVIIRSALMLPGTNVTIYARELRFEDTAGKDASLETTPSNFKTGAVQFANGLPGQKAGDITLRLEKFYSQPGKTIRFIARGASGQDAGQGRAGAPKPDLIPSGPVVGHPDNPGASPWSMRWAASITRVVLNWPFKRQGWGWVSDQNGNRFPQFPEDYPKVVYVYCKPCGQYTAGKQQWPEDGEDARVGGKPGIGGAGATVVSTLPNIKDFTNVSGGVSGRPGAAQKGGPPQNPIYSAWLETVDGNRCDKDHFNFRIMAVHRAVAGKDAPSIPADQPQGPDGKFQLLDAASQSWAHPALLRAVLAHAKYAYLNNRFDYAYSVFSDYQSLLTNLPVPTDETTALEFAQCQSEIDKNVFSLNAGLDYWGNKANWVPLLSLSAIMQTFNDEADAMIHTLYLSYLLEQRAAANQKDVKVIQEAIANLNDDVSSLSDEANTALEAIPDLEYKAEAVKAKLITVQNHLLQKEKELEDRAAANVAERHKSKWWKTGLNIIATIAKVQPFGQPAVGMIATGAQAIANFDTSKPLQSIIALADVASTYAGSDYQKAATSLQSFFDDQKKDETKLSRIGHKKAVDAFKLLSNEGKKIAPAVKLIANEFKTKKIDNAEVQAELDRLKAQSTEFNALIDEVNELNLQKQEFISLYDDTTHKALTFSNQVGQDLLTMANLSRNLDPTIASFDFTTLQAIREMKRAAQERLLKYQYWMARAYEYRFLKPYPQELNLNSLVDRITTMLGANATLTADQFTALKAVYTNSVRTIIDQGLTELSQKAPEKSLPFLFELTASELQSLNESGEVRIDIASRIAGLPNEDNRHLASLSLDGIQIENNSGAGGRIRLIAEHKGESVETANGKTYRFSFGTGSVDETPFTYGFSYEPSVNKVYQEELSVAGIAELQSFLGINAPIDPKNAALQYFVRPGADAVMTLRKYDDTHTKVTKLRFAATVDFFRTNTNQVWLNVQSPADTMPVIAIEQADLNGRTDGRGSFKRAYRVGTSVKLTAEPVYGGLRFKQWLSQTGTPLSNSNTMVVSLSSSRTVRASYEADIAPNLPPVVTPQTVTVKQGSANPAVALASVGDFEDAANKLSATATAVPTGITLSSLTNNNGTITAGISVDCSAKIGSSVINLQVKDSAGNITTSAVPLSIVANIPPTLGTYPSTSVSKGGEITIKPISTPTGNAKLEVVAPLVFNGDLSVNAAGEILVKNAAPVGTYSLTVTATDNCGAKTSSKASLIVTEGACNSLNFVSNSYSISSPVVGPAAGGSFIVEDVDNDENADIIAVHGRPFFRPQNKIRLPFMYGDEWLSILNGRIGNGNFEQPQNYELGEQPTNVVSGDVNKDGLTDLVIADQGIVGTPSLTILENEGHGLFKTKRLATPEFGGWDLVIGQFEPGSRSLARIQPDTYYVSRSVVILPSKDDGTFGEMRKIPVDISAQVLTVADLNNDKADDLLVGYAETVCYNCTYKPGKVALLLSDGKGNFKESGEIELRQSPISINVFDNEGKWLYVTTDVGVWLYKQGENGKFDFVQLISNRSSLATHGDFYQDGRPALVVFSNEQKKMTFYRFDGQQFMSKDEWATSATASSIKAAKLGADKQPGVILFDRSQNKVIVFRSQCQ